MDNPNLTERLKCCNLTMVDNMSKEYKLYLLQTALDLKLCKHKMELQNARIGIYCNPHTNGHPIKRYGFFPNRNIL